MEQINVLPWVLGGDPLLTALALEPLPKPPQDKIYKQITFRIHVFFLYSNN